MDSNSNLTRFIYLIPGLSPGLLKKLSKNNIRLVKSLSLLSDEDLENHYGFEKNEIEEINSKIKTCSLHNIESITGIELDQNCKYIRSGCKGFDKVFGNYGLPTGRLTQIYGEAGAGKSQICFQLCFKVQLEIFEGGLNGDVLYFDTEKSFRPERVIEIARCYLKDKYAQKSLLEFKLEEILSRIHIRNFNTNADDLEDIILNGKLDSFLDSHSNIKLFIFDGIAYHFRYDYVHDDQTRTRQLVEIGKKLKQIADERNIAVLITNQVKMETQPALGDLWNTTCSTSLHLSRSPTIDHQGTIHGFSNRYCTVMKSPSIRNGFRFQFVINIRLMDKFDREIQDTMENIKQNRKVEIKRKKKILTDTTKILMDKQLVNISSKSIPYAVGSPEQLMVRRDRMSKAFLTTRMKILNVNFSRAINEILITDQEFSKNINDNHIQLTQIRVSQDYQFLQIYWTTNLDDRNMVASYLNTIKGRLHELLSEVFSRNVPWILFVYDIQASYENDLSKRLDQCKKESAQNSSKILESNALNSRLKDRICFEVDKSVDDDDESLENLQMKSASDYFSRIEIPQDMFLRTFDLDYETLYNKVVQNMHRTRAHHAEDLSKLKFFETQSIKNDNGPNPHFNENTTYKPLQIEYNTENRIKTIKKFVAMNKKRKDKLELKLKQMILSEEIDRFSCYEQLRESIEENYSDLFKDKSFSWKNDSEDDDHGSVDRGNNHLS